MARPYRHPKMEDVELSDALRALADPIRLQIVASLLERAETTCAPLADELGIADSTLSHHLRMLREAGITRTTIDGVQRHVSLRSDEIDARFPGLLLAVEHGLRDNLARPQPASTGLTPAVVGRPTRGGRRGAEASGAPATRGRSRRPTADQT